MAPNGSEGTSAEFGGARAHLIDPKTECLAWATDPAGFVLRLPPAHTRIDGDVATFLMDRVYPLALSARDDSSGRIIGVGDWRRMASYDSEARRRLTEWATTNRATIERLVAVIPEKNRFVSMGVHVAASILSVRGLRLDITHSFTHAVARAAVRPHPAGKKLAAAV